MSQKPDDFNRGKRDDSLITGEKDPMSDKKCSANQPESDSESNSDDSDPERPNRVGLRGGRYKRFSLAQKLAARTIARPNGCWEVQGCRGNRSGHVHLSIGSTWNPPYIRIYAHKFAWEQANHRKVPKGMVVMHSCDNPRCVNPAHLSIGTQRDNVLDSIRKGRYNVFGHQKLNAEQVREIRALSLTGMLQKDIAAKFGVARNTVSGIVNRKSWDHLDRPFVRAVLERVPSVHLEIRGEVA